MQPSTITEFVELFNIEEYPIFLNSQFFIVISSVPFKVIPYTFDFLSAPLASKIEFKIVIIFYSPLYATITGLEKVAFSITTSTSLGIVTVPVNVDPLALM